MLYYIFLEDGTLLETTTDEEYASNMADMHEGYYCCDEQFEESFDDYEDYDLEMGFDPYCGCYSFDC